MRGNISQHTCNNGIHIYDNIRLITKISISSESNGKFSGKMDRCHKNETLLFFKPNVQDLTILNIRVPMQQLLWRFGFFFPFKSITYKSVSIRKIYKAWIFTSTSIQTRIFVRRKGDLISFMHGEQRFITVPSPPLKNAGYAL